MATTVLSLFLAFRPEKIEVKKLLLKCQTSLSFWRTTSVTGDIHAFNPDSQVSTPTLDNLTGGGKWKCVDGKGSGGWSKDESETADVKEQLYDLSIDPSEKKLFKKHPEIAGKMKKGLDSQNDKGFTRPGARQ
jgi:hypothetical protein